MENKNSSLFVLEDVTPGSSLVVISVYKYDSENNLRPENVVSLQYLMRQEDEEIKNY